MVPQIIKTKDYIEFIGHYDDITKCAKLSALASLYAIDSRVGYAKFPIEYEKDINKALNCSNIFAVSYRMYSYLNNKSTGTNLGSSRQIFYCKNLYFKYNDEFLLCSTIYHDAYSYSDSSNSFIRLNLQTSNQSYTIFNQKGGSHSNVVESLNLYYDSNSSIRSNTASNITLSGYGIKMVDGTDYTIDSSNNGSLFSKVYASRYNTQDFSVTFNFLPLQTSSPLTKTYNVGTFINDNQEYNQIVINGMSSDSSTFESITDMDYRNTLTEASDTVYSNNAWNGDFNSVLNYTTTAPDVTEVNSDCNSIITFTTNQVEPAKSISIGAIPLSASYVGTSTVNKIYYGTSLLYEKQAPSGYTVSGTSDAGGDVAYYSTDDGATWLDIPNGNFTLPAMATFKLKLEPGADYLMSASSSQLGLNLPLTEADTQISENYTLTENITDLTIHGEWD